MTIQEEYFAWICTLVRTDNRLKMMTILSDTQFTPIHQLDDNRVSDAYAIRKDFIDDCTNRSTQEIEEFIKDIPSVLDVMIALAIRMEIEVMEEKDYGDRTTLWFWMMLKSLGLYDMTDDYFDWEYATHQLSRFLSNDIERDGKGGLFTVAGVKEDMRDADIWKQMCLFANKLLL